jgi:hypothetical protein
MNSTVIPNLIPNLIFFEGKPYYNATELCQCDVHFFRGCSQIRLIIERKKIPETEYMFGYIKNEKWIKSNKNYMKAHLLISEEWCNKNIPIFKNTLHTFYSQCADIPALCEESTVLLRQHSPSFSDNNNIINNDNEEINDGDAANNIISKLKIYGDSTTQSFFSLKNTCEVFQLPLIHTCIISKDNFYEVNKDYVFFRNENNEIQLFFTIDGVIKLLYSHRNTHASVFFNWIISNTKNKTNETNEEMDGAFIEPPIIAVNQQHIKSVFHCNVAKTPAIYLYSIGKANELLEGDYIDNDILCKFGCTDNLPRRCSEHFRKYNKEFNTEIQLICFSIVEPEFLYMAELCLKEYLKTNIVSYKNSLELCIINKRNIVQIKKHFALIQNSYVGKYQELHKNIANLEKTIVSLNNTIELKNKDLEIQQILFKNKIQQKEMDILRLKCKEISGNQYISNNTTTVLTPLQKKSKKAGNCMFL